MCYKSGFWCSQTFNFPAWDFCHCFAFTRCHFAQCAGVSGEARFMRCCPQRATCNAAVSHRKSLPLCRSVLSHRWLFEEFLCESFWIMYVCFRTISFSLGLFTPDPKPVHVRSIWKRFQTYLHISVSTLEVQIWLAHPWSWNVPPALKSAFPTPIRSAVRREVRS